MFAISLGPDGAELRPLEPWQARELYDHVERGREFIGRYIGFPDTVPDEARARAVLGWFAEKQAADGARIYGLWREGTLVGSVLFRLFDAAAGTCEVGCWLEPAGTGHGLVTRAVRVLIDWAVDERGIHRVEWVAASTNRASVKVAERLGMTRDGVLRESYAHRGERLDMEVWSVLAPEWRAARARGEAASPAR